MGLPMTLHLLQYTGRYMNLLPIFSYSQQPRIPGQSLAHLSDVNMGYIPSDALFETRLYKRFTHIGSKRRLKWLPDPGSPTGYSRSTQYDWGNFISYLNKANLVMKEINGDNTIINQYRKVWNNFHEIKKQTYETINNFNNSKPQFSAFSTSYTLQTLLR